VRPGPRRSKYAKVARLNLTVPKNVLELMKRLEQHGVDVNLSRIATEAFEKTAAGLLGKLNDPIEGCSHCSKTGHCSNCSGTGYCTRSKNEEAARASGLG